jgi:hypothetical protein
LVITCFCSPGTMLTLTPPSAMLAWIACAMSFQGEVLGASSSTSKPSE